MMSEFKKGDIVQSYRGGVTTTGLVLKDGADFSERINDFEFFIYDKELEGNHKVIGNIFNECVLSRSSSSRIQEIDRYLSGNKDILDFVCWASDIVENKIHGILKRYVPQDELPDPYEKIRQEFARMEETLIYGISQRYKGAK